MASEVDGAPEQFELHAQYGRVLEVYADRFLVDAHDGAAARLQVTASRLTRKSSPVGRWAGVGAWGTTRLSTWSKVAAWNSVQVTQVASSCTVTRVSLMASTLLLRSCSATPAALQSMKRTPCPKFRCSWICTGPALSSIQVTIRASALIPVDDDHARE